MAPSEPHQVVVDYVAEHPAFKQVLDDDFLAELGNRESQADREFPEIYCCIAEPGRVNLDTLEAGLQFVLDRADTEHRNEVIRKLQQSSDQDVGTVFELAVFGALLLDFGQDQIALYPSVGKERESDACLLTAEGAVYVEATVLNFPKRALEAFRQMRLAGRNVGDAHWVDIGDRDVALLRKVESKFEQHMPGAPNVLALSRYDSVRGEDIDLFRQHFEANGSRDPLGHFAGMFHLRRFEEPQWLANERCSKDSALSKVVVGSLERALKRMAPPKAPA